MNRVHKFLAATFILAAMFCAQPAFGQGCGLHDSPIDCTQKEAQAAANQKSYMEAVNSKSEFNQEIAVARTQFWATYPAKPGAEAARRKFADLLREKDMYYLNLAQYSQGMAPTDQAVQGAIGKLLDGYVGGVPLDGGIPQSAKPEFSDWTLAFAKNLAAAGGLLTTQASANAFKALAASQKEYDRYILERDLAEFDAAGRKPVGFVRSDGVTAAPNQNVSAKQPAPVSVAASTPSSKTPASKGASQPPSASPAPPSVAASNQVPPKAVVPNPAPSNQAPQTPPVQAVTPATPAAPPGAAPQASDFRLRIAADSRRLNKDNFDLSQVERSTRTKRPTDVQEALDRVRRQIAAGQFAAAKGDTGQAEQVLQDAEAALATIEKSLGR